MQKIMGKKREPCWELEGKKNRARGEHPIQFRKRSSSEYKHKGFITGRSLLKAAANSPSSSTREEKRGGKGGEDRMTARSGGERGEVTMAVGGKISKDKLKNTTNLINWVISDQCLVSSTRRYRQYFQQYWSNLQYWYRKGNMSSNNTINGTELN
ncbi:uncharacterized protein V6R79_016892 [Siganus canaliculatus]